MIYFSGYNKRSVFRDPRKHYASLQQFEPDVVDVEFV